MGTAAYIDFWVVTSDEFDFVAERLGLRLSAARALARGWMTAVKWDRLAAEITTRAAKPSGRAVSTASRNRARERVGHRVGEQLHGA